LAAICAEAKQREVDAGLCSAEPDVDPVLMFPFPQPGLRASQTLFSPDAVVGDTERPEPDEQPSFKWNDGDEDAERQQFIRGPGQQQSRQQPRRQSRAERRQ
jgi:hypothetical protein